MPAKSMRGSARPRRLAAMLAVADAGDIASARSLSGLSMPRSRLCEEPATSRRAVVPLRQWDRTSLADAVKDTMPVANAAANEAAAPLHFRLALRSPACRRARSRPHLATAAELIDPRRNPDGTEISAAAEIKRNSRSTWFGVAGSAFARSTISFAPVRSWIKPWRPAGVGRAKTLQGTADEIEAPSTIPMMRQPHQ